MKRKSSANSLIALSFLFVAVFSVGLILKNMSTIEASTLSEYSDQNPNFLALKFGENQFVAAQTIDQDTEIFGINGSLISIAEAKGRGIIESAYLFEGRKVLGIDMAQIEPNQQFTVLVSDISLAPTIYLGGVK